MRPATAALIVKPMAVTEAPRVRRSDVAVAAAVVAASLLAVVVLADRDADPLARSFDLLTGILIVAAGGALAFYRRAPLAVLVVTTAAVSLYSLRDYPGGPIYLAWIGAIFAVSVARGPSKAWLPVLASAAVVLVTAFAIGGHHAGERLVEGRDPAGVLAVVYASWAGMAALLGGSVRGRRIERAAMEERARHLAETRDEEARRRVAEERLRIARDLHDSVAHSMASISVQAGVGAHVLEERPADAREAFLAIKDASGRALAELRATLGMLRSDQAAAPREPTAGLDRLPALVDSSRAAGLEVDVVVEGEARTLPPAVDTAAFRIVQESLTNVIRHAGATRATVAVRHGDDDVEIEVTDDGRGAGPSTAGASAAVASGGGPSGGGDGGGGHGLAGMRERAALLGGELSAGHRRSGGYRVRARLPR
jgi:signal transduction histidine kinase